MAAALTALSAVPILIAAIGPAVDASENADDFLADHPDASRTVALIGSYGAAVLIALLVLFMVLAARGLQRGRRWAWIALLVVGLIGITALARATALSVAEGTVSLALVVALMLPRARQFTGVMKARQRV